LQFKKIFLALSLWGAACAQAETAWLNIMGDPADPAVNTIEVDPTPVSLSKDGRAMLVRGSRSAERTSWDGISYRSYQALVLFDCVDRTARYLSIEFYAEPGWKGQSHHTSLYQDPPRWMMFRDVEPNPAQRIVRAACDSASVNSN
jgi:hypothetical protein